MCLFWFKNIWTIKIDQLFSKVKKYLFLFINFKREQISTSDGDLGFCTELKNLNLEISAAYDSLKNQKIDDFDADFDSAAPIYDNEEDFFDNWQKRVERKTIY